MEKIIYFEESDGKHGVIRFVMDYQRRKWYRRAKVSYTLMIDHANRYQTYSEEDFEDVRACIKRDYPNARVWMADTDWFEIHYSLKRFWVICTWLRNGRIGYYSDNDSSYKAEYTEDLTDVRMILAESSANETLQNIQRSTRDRVWVQMIYLTLKNELLTPVMMITCTGRKSEATKYFAKIDKGNRLRLVNTSDAAAKFPYEEAMQMFEYLRTHNKNFLYAVLPVFKDNVNCRNLEAYMKENNVSRMIALDFKLRFLKEIFSEKDKISNIIS